MKIRMKYWIEYISYKTWLLSFVWSWLPYLERENIYNIET